MKTQFRLLPVAALVAAVLAGCSTMPAADSPLVLARGEYNAAQSNPQVASLAADELHQAGDSLQRANAASSKGEKDAVVDHLAYLASQKVMIAREAASQRAAEAAVANSTMERDRVRLEARTREANLAQRSAAAAQRDAEAAQRAAAAAEMNAAAAQRRIETAKMESEASQREAANALREANQQKQAAGEAQASAAAALARAQDVEAHNAKLTAQLRELEAKQTERGMVVTLGDVLFDTDKAQLRQGGMRSVRKLADFFREYPQRKVMIEGFTDSTGSAVHNQALSDERAMSVKNALMGMGVNSERIGTRGYGESYPVAANDSATGRQVNRRVEIIVSDDSGKIAPRT